MNARWKVAQAAEIRWWQSYLKKKDKENYLAWKKKYWLDFLAKINIQVPPNVHCLDAGCGPAGIFTILDNQKCTAIDPLLDAYEKKLPHFNKKEYPHTSFRQLPLEEIDYHSEFDYLFCLNVINHVADIKAAMTKLSYALKPGGTLVLSIDAHNYSFFKHLFRLLPGDILHPHQYNLTEYQELVNRQNCQILDTVLIDKHFFFNYFVIVAKRM